MDILLYIQLYESKKERGQAHAAKSIIVKDFSRSSPQVEGSGGGRRDHDVGDRREAHLGILEKEGGEVMPLEKTGVPGIYKVYGKKGRVKYQLQQNVQVQDPLSPSGFRWKLVGIRFAKFQDAVNQKVKTQAEIKAGKYVEPSDVTVKEMLAAWLKAGETRGVTKHGKWKIQTCLSHETQYGYIVPKLGEIKASKLRKVSDRASGCGMERGQKLGGSQRAPRHAECGFQMGA
jgi:hypothetical protein